MTRKDFELIARTIKELREGPRALALHALSETAHAEIAREFAGALRSTNANFNRARFLRACGVEE